MLVSVGTELVGGVEVVRVGWEKVVVVSVVGDPGGEAVTRDVVGTIVAVVVV